MSGKNLLEGRTGPVTQSIDAIKALLTWKGHPVSPLPSDVTLDNGRLVLVLSNKKDAYYTVTATKCSCPAATYHQGPCKHSRKYFGAKPMPMPMPTTSEPMVKRGGFKPVDTLPGEEMRAAKASSSMLIDCHDTRNIDVAYHSIKYDREMWAALGEA